MDRFTGFSSIGAIWLAALGCNAHGEEDAQGSREAGAPDAATSNGGSAGRGTLPAGGVRNSDAGNLGGRTSAGGAKASGGASVATGCDPAAQQPGTWKNVTPPAMDLANSWGGCQAILIDPVRPSDLYLNCDSVGTWKSTDCGLTWAKTNTGLNGAKVDGGRQWGAVIDGDPARDPNTPPTLWVTLGYGNLGLWRSSNGGVDWTDVWTDNIYDGTTNISADVNVDIAMVYGVEPAHPDHLIANLHSYWGTGDNNGIFETTDGGGKWLVHKARTFNFMNYGDIMFPINSTTWMVAHGTQYPNGELWRTTDSGASWNLLPMGADWAVGHQTGRGNYVCRVGSTVYVPSYLGGVFKTTDEGASWTKIKVDFQDVFALFASRTNLYIAGGTDLWDHNFRFQHASLENDTVWIDDPVPTGLKFGSPIGTGVPGWGAAVFDGSHTVVVTSNYGDGAWRYVVPN